MDKTFVASRLKKYLFLISIIFMILTSTHLIYSYIYSDAKETAVPGGSISEAIIGDIPNLNPLRNNTEQNRYINTMLYRSLLQYDVSKKKIIGDLAKCDISNLLEIECFLEPNIKWSNGEAITNKDIIETYNTLKSTNINKAMFSILQSVTIEETQTGIIFKNNKKDINVLKIFFQPIVSNTILSTISKKELEGSFTLTSGVYSGMYKVVSILKDETFNITTITLERNEEYSQNPVYIDVIVFKVFPTVKDFLKNKNSINIFNDKDNLIAGTIPRLKEYQYILPQYVSLFFNTKKIEDTNLRGLISQLILPEEIVAKLGEKRFQTVQNHFLTDTYIEESPATGSIGAELNKQGYFSYLALVSKLESDLAEEAKKMSEAEKKETKEVIEPVQTSLVSSEAQLTSGTIESGPTLTQEITKTKENPNSEIIVSPNWVERYNFVQKDDILLQGNVTNKATAIYIGDYKIQNYKAGSTTFYYRLTEEFDNIQQGDNTYVIYAEIDGEKVELETLDFYYNTNKAELDAKEKEILTETVTVEVTPQEEKAEETENNKDDTQEETSENISEEIVEEDSQNSDVATTQTGSISEEEGSNKTTEYLDIEEKINFLKNKDSRFFYNTEGVVYSLEVYYISEKNDYELTAQYIKETLEKEGIEVQLRGITTDDLKVLLSEEKKNYDILLAGINLSYFDFNIYSYFHSDQIEGGFNFANFRKLDLDIVLEELKSKVLSAEEILALEKKALKLIQENHISKTLYTPVISNLVDKNIKGYSLKENIPEQIYRYHPLQKSYVKEDKFIIMENKTVIGYFKFLKDLLF